MGRLTTCRPAAVIRLVSSLASKTHKTLHYAETDETMVHLPSCPCFVNRTHYPQVPLFEREPDGSSRGQRYIMGRRNYCEIDWDRSSGDVIFDVRIEKGKGVGQTVGCVSSPYTIPSNCNPSSSSHSMTLADCCSPATPSARHRLGGKPCAVS